jgi:protoporphyrinogen oxidase
MIVRSYHETGSYGNRLSMGKIEFGRRRFLKGALLGTAAARSATLFTAREAFGAITSDPRAPIAVIAAGATPTSFLGDDFTRPHAALWRKEAFLAEKGGIPAPTREVSTVIVGGGMSGLCAAFGLRDRKPMVLEQAPRFGGNSKGERWGDLTYSIGAAYLNPPAEGSPPAKLLEELGLTKLVRRDHEQYQTALLDGKLRTPFWKGATDPGRAGEFERVWKKLHEVYAKSYPEIPAVPGGSMTSAALNALDKHSLAEWVRAELGVIHPHIDEFFEEYCWSSFGGGASEVSAAQALNFIAADLDGISVLPGGNSTITEALYRKLSTSLPGEHLETGALVVDVSTNAAGVRVCYENSDGKLVSIQARNCIYASPKFTAARVINGLPESQYEAISKIKYRAYLVANVLLKEKVPSPGYDLFRVTGKGTGSVKDQPFTDLIFGGWAAQDQARRSALTLYKAFGYDGGRPELYMKKAYERESAKFEAALPELLGALRIPRSLVSGIRITRWGHALPLAATGLIADGTLARASKPIAGKIFFAQQDNWCSPGFEGALKAALDAVAAIKAADQRSS